MTYRQAGFTIIEGVIVVAIIGITAIATLPLMTNVLTALAVNESKGAAEQVASAIQQTRAYAILQSATYEVWFPGTNHNQVQIACLSSCPDGAPAEGPTPLVNGGLVTPQGAADPACGGNWCIFFNSTGTSSGGTLTVNLGNQPRVVSVTVAGMVQVTIP